MKIGIVGLGGMASVHFNTYSHIDHADAAGAVGETEQDKTRAAAWGVPVFNSIHEMVENIHPDLVDVCTPTFLHKEHVI
jgi:predicted dehydrogenase